MVLRDCIAAGNWKMYKTSEEAVAYIQALTPLVTDSTAKVYLAVPFTAIQPTAAAAADTNIVIGAQNMNDASEGAFTGEIAAAMLIEAGAKFIILGHSERRHIFGESDEFINRKVKKALAEGLQPILCIGETKQQREARQTEEVLKNQLWESLADVTAQQLADVVIAYEPVWAIGTGLTATSAMAQDAHNHCRKLIAEKWSPEAAEGMLILYGGSVKPNNAKELMSQPDVDGVLVGGASLEPEGFAQIVQSKPTIENQK